MSDEICDLTGYTALDQINEKARMPMSLDDHSPVQPIPLFDFCTIRPDGPTGSSIRMASRSSVRP
ncbi:MULTISPECIES: hypothetical protein [Methylomicrobium]|uniref:hypothetical protein n=1 Tax=Methylomicrobium TaxID=39773 RepID=UPI0002623D8F|nr:MULTISPECIES: hypothetical protein [Methylomicrobium]